MPLSARSYNIFAPAQSHSVRTEKNSGIADLAGKVIKRSRRNPAEPFSKPFSVCLMVRLLIIRKKNLRPIRSHLRIRASQGEADLRCRPLHPSHNSCASAHSYIDLKRSRHRRSGLPAALVDADVCGFSQISSPCQPILGL